MTRYMLDTNATSALVKDNANVTKRLITAPAISLCISAITEGEICFGLAKRPEAKKLHRVVTEILLRVDVLPWNHEVAQVYGNLRAELESVGKQPGPVNILTAAHALQVGAVFITSDRAFQYVAGLVVEDWGA